MSVAPSPTFSLLLRVAAIATSIATAGTIVLEIAGEFLAALVVIAMLFLTVVIALRRWSS